MKTKSTNVFKRFDTFRQMLSRLKPMRSVAAASMSILCLFPTSVFAHPVSNYLGLEIPTIYVQAGLEVNPVGEEGMPGPGEHPFSVDLGAFWDPNMEPTAPTPPVLIDRGPGSGVEFRGSSAHVFAPHPGEVAPGPTWSYDISVGDPPGPFGAVETRVRGSVGHGHPDHYMAVVGVLKGTAPGAPVGPRRVIIGGSIGRHSHPYPGLPNKEPIYGGGELEPPSGMPSPGNLDYPMAELLTIVDTEDTPNPHFSMMAMVDGLLGNMINNVFLRQGSPNGPILMDLRPMMQTQHLGDYGSLLTIPDAVMPPHIVQMIGSENAYVSMEFPASIHPDGALVGAISLVQDQPLQGDYNGDSHADSADYVIGRKTSPKWHKVGLGEDNGDGYEDDSDYSHWRRHFGESADNDVEWVLRGATVPEPASALLLTFAAALGIRRRRRIA